LLAVAVVLVEIIPHLMVVLVVVEPVIILVVDLMDTQGQDLEVVEDTLREVTVVLVDVLLSIQPQQKVLQLDMI
jgi:hypothetical protein